MCKGVIVTHTLQAFRTKDLISKAVMGWTVVVITSHTNGESIPKERT